MPLTHTISLTRLHHPLQRQHLPHNHDHNYNHTKGLFNDAFFTQHHPFSLAFFVCRYACCRARLSPYLHFFFVILSCRHVLLLFLFFFPSFGKLKLTTSLHFSLFFVGQYFGAWPRSGTSVSCFKGIPYIDSFSFGFAVCTPNFFKSR